MGKRPIKTTTPEQIKKIGQLLETTALNGSQIADEVGVTRNVAQYYIRKIKDRKSGLAVAKAKATRQKTFDYTASMTTEVDFLRAENDFLKKFIAKELRK